MQEENIITLINIYAPNTEKPKYIRQLLSVINGQIDNSKIIVGNFNPPINGQKINKATEYQYQ